jgi:hypothetical protein
MFRISRHYILISTISIIGLAQAQFSIDAYRQFLQQHENLEASQLLSMHPAGVFRNNVYTPWESALYADSIEIKYQVTTNEKELITQHGFVVSERLQGASFGTHYADIFHKDLPVFISSDAILHAFHRSYDTILKRIELEYLIPTLKNFLGGLYQDMDQLKSRYEGQETVKPYLEDIDLYLTVPRKLLDENEEPYFSVNKNKVDEFVTYIDAENPQDIPFFSGSQRDIDFSQFKPRGHYDDPYNPELAAYFRAMIWLGRMELYLLKPEGVLNGPTDADVCRQAIMSALIYELIEITSSMDACRAIEAVLNFLVGNQDNVTLEHLAGLFTELNITLSSQLLDDDTMQKFQHQLALQPYADQKILSQILFRDPMSPDSIQPASAFLLYGQRFIIDSYITGSVVYDKILYEGQPVLRMLPSTLDILFALGNDAAAQLLTEELERYHYAGNLAGLRYLVDSYEPDFWRVSFYHKWLDAIRTLNPGSERRDYPRFMQTAAWWQMKMNSQLGSWAELRHDHLLYAKPSYTGGAVCSYPYSYIEPVPAFYHSMGELALMIKDTLNILLADAGQEMTDISFYMNRFQSVMDTLEMIAVKELTDQNLDQVEKKFLSCMISSVPDCVPRYRGWYNDLYYYNEDFLEENNIVVDYHTAPTDEVGMIVGWVQHAGTGPVDLAILVANFEGKNTAFIGPVYGYYEYTTTNFQRLTDKEWSENYLAQAARPQWTNFYLTDSKGQKKDNIIKLITSVPESPTSNSQIPESYIMISNYPNPFNAETMITYTIPHQLGNRETVLTIHDIRGRVVKRLLNGILSSGRYLTRWDGTNDAGATVSSGIYFYHLQVANHAKSGKMVLVR